MTAKTCTKFLSLPVCEWNWLAFLLLLVLKANGMDVSWWIVFLPVAWSLYVVAALLALLGVGVGLAGVVYGILSLCMWVDESLRRRRRRRNSRNT